LTTKQHEPFAYRLPQLCNAATLKSRKGSASDISLNIQNVALHQLECALGIRYHAKRMAGMSAEYIHRRGTRAETLQPVGALRVLRMPSQVDFTGVRRLTPAAKGVLFMREGRGDVTRLLPPSYDWPTVSAASLPHDYVNKIS
jgi:hypothetical protein